MEMPEPINEMNSQADIGILTSASPNISGEGNRLDVSPVSDSLDDISNRLVNLFCPDFGQPHICLRTFKHDSFVCYFD